MSSRGLSELQAWIVELSADTPFGCLIVQGGETVAEWYGNGLSADSIFEIGSIRKSFNSALIGWGVENGDFGYDLRVNEVWPHFVEMSGDPADADITLHDLASATSGWLTPDARGTNYRYNNAGFTAAERVVARFYGWPDDEIAPEVERRFKDALGAETWRVYHFNHRQLDPKDFSQTGPKVAIDSNLRDLVKWGELWLGKGEWRGRRLIPARHVETATHRVNPHIPNAYYGYNWFVNADQALWPGAPGDSFGHIGNGTFKPSEVPSRANLWIWPEREVVAVSVAERWPRFGDDYLDFPQSPTAEWIARVSISVA